jgi:hypothetical protein
MQRARAVHSCQPDGPKTVRDGGLGRYQNKLNEMVHRSNGPLKEHREPPARHVAERTVQMQDTYVEQPKSRWMILGTENPNGHKLTKATECDVNLFVV